VIRRSNAARVWLGVLALACAFAAPAQAQTATVAQGPMIGAVTDTSAAVWFRLSAPGLVRVRWLGPDAADYTYSDQVIVTPDADDTGKMAITGLVAGQTYTYQVGIFDEASGSETWGGAYTFATVPAAVDHVSFSVLSDFSNKLKGSPALRDALSKNPDFLAVIGDLDHRNPASETKRSYYPKEDAALVLADMRAMHRDTRDFATPIGSDFAAGLIGQPDSGQRQIPLYYGWDDHDFCTNNAGATCPFAEQAVQAYREYYLWQPDNGIDGSNGPAYTGDAMATTRHPAAIIFRLDITDTPTRFQCNFMVVPRLGRRPLEGTSPPLGVTQRTRIIRYALLPLARCVRQENYTSIRTRSSFTEFKNTITSGPRCNTAA